MATLVSGLSFERAEVAVPVTGLAVSAVSAGASAGIHRIGVVAAVSNATNPVSRSATAVPPSTRAAAAASPSRAAGSVCRSAGCIGWVATGGPGSPKASRHLPSSVRSGLLRPVPGCNPAPCPAPCTAVPCERMPWSPRTGCSRSDVRCSRMCHQPHDGFCRITQTMAAQSYRFFTRPRP